MTKESAKQRAAFDVYFSLGEKRSVTRTAQILGSQFGPIQKWASAFDWKKRAEEMDEALQEFFKDKNATHILAIRKKFLGTIEAALDKAVTLHADGQTVKSTKVRIANASDLEKLVKTHALLTDNATENVKQTGPVEFKVEFV